MSYQLCSVMSFSGCYAENSRCKQAFQLRHLKGGHQVQCSKVTSPSLFMQAGAARHRGIDILQLASRLRQMI